eukprot:828702-Prorocentrum_minimum.AAC.2
MAMRGAPEALSVRDERVSRGLRSKGMAAVNASRERDVRVPGAAEGVVDRAGDALLGSELVVPADEEVPLHIDRADEGVVGDPSEAVQKATGRRLEWVAKLAPSGLGVKIVS